VVQELQVKITQIDARLDGIKDKEGKEGKEHEKSPKDGDKESVELTGLTPPGSALPGPDQAEGDERTFISLDDRPEVGGTALSDPDEDE
jgi:hypothetical protein